MARVRLNPNYASDVINNWIDHRLLDYHWTMSDLSRETEIPLGTLMDRRRKKKPIAYTVPQLAKICRVLGCTKEKAAYFLLEMAI